MKLVEEVEPQLLITHQNQITTRGRRHYSNLHPFRKIPPKFHSSNCSFIRIIWFCNQEFASMTTRYWVASLPIAQGSSSSSLWSRLQESISKQAFDTALYRVTIWFLRNSARISREL